MKRIFSYASTYFCRKGTPPSTTISLRFRRCSSRGLAKVTKWRSKLASRVRARIHQRATHSLSSGHVRPSHCHQVSAASAFTLPSVGAPTSWHNPQEHNLSFFPLPGWLGPSTAVSIGTQVETFESFFFFKEEKHPDTTEKILLNSVQLSGFLPHWREQVANSSSKAVRIFALSLLWLSSRQERHVATVDSSLAASCSRAVTRHLWFPLDLVLPLNSGRNGLPWPAPEHGN